MTFRTVSDLDARGKTVFCRVDFNVPLENGRISDDRRIRAVLPTIETLRQAGARVLCASHLGRPKGRRVEELSLAPVAARLGELLGMTVPLADDCIGEPANRLVASLPESGVGLLENLRFHSGETEGSASFARALADSAELYVNDAFGAAHRAHASVVGVPDLLGTAAAGHLMQAELVALRRIASSPARPYAAILGGAKVSDKIALIERLLTRVDHILVGGAMAYTLLAARGVPVGASRIESDRLELARELTERTERSGVAFHLPIDHVVASSLDGHDAAGLATTPGQEIPEGRIGLDIGPATIRTWTEDVLTPQTATVLWNGPLGLFEAEGCEVGTRAVAQHLATLPAFRVLGGGDTAAAAARFGLDDAYDHVSTGGGAALELLSGIPLPGVLALERNSG